AVAPRRGEIVQDPRGFLFFVLERPRLDLVTRFPVGGELLLEKLRVLGEDAARGLEDLPRAAAVFVEHDRLDLVVPFEPDQDVRIGAGPGEDRLLVVADGKEIVMRGRKALEE